MSSVPTAERPPQGLDAYWLGVWRHALKTLKEQGTWAWEQKPLLDEYVYGLIAADKARRHDDNTGWDRNSKRAASIADQLALTPRGRKAIGLFDDSEEPGSRFDDLDELTARRNKG